jgi:hypothetical protein
MEGLWDTNYASLLIFFNQYLILILLVKLVLLISDSFRITTSFVIRPYLFLPSVFPCI